MSQLTFFNKKKSYYQIGPASKCKGVETDLSLLGQSQVRISSLLHNELARPLDVKRPLLKIRSACIIVLGSRGVQVENLDLFNMIMFHALRIPSLHWGMSTTWTLNLRGNRWDSSLQLSSSSFPGGLAKVSVFKKERSFRDASIHVSALCNLASSQETSRKETIWKTSRKPADSSSVGFFGLLH
jgi:hypothetical protein